MEGLSRKLDSAIRDMDRRLSRGDLQMNRQAVLEGARDEINSVLDEVSPQRGGGGGAAASPLSKVAQRFRHSSSSSPSNDIVQHLRNLEDEIRWIDEESIQSQKEMEDRLESRLVLLEARIVAAEARITQSGEIGHVDSKLKEIERRLDAQEAVSKRTRLTLEELADKVAILVNELSPSPPTRSSELPLVRSKGISTSRHHSHSEKVDMRPTSKSSRSDSLLRELSSRIESLENELEGERDRSIKAVELVASALHTRPPSPAASSSSLRRGSVSSSSTGRRGEQRGLVRDRNGEYRSPYG